MEKYIQLVQKLYTEPNDEDILGSFVQVETTGTDEVAKVPRAVSEPKKRKNKSEVKTTFGIFLNATVNKQRIICIKEPTRIKHQKKKL